MTALDLSITFRDCGSTALAQVHTHTHAHTHTRTRTHTRTHHDCDGPEQRLQGLWQLSAADVARVHGDEAAGALLEGHLNTI
jgi:hypothetical protein